MCRSAKWAAAFAMLIAPAPPALAQSPDERFTAEVVKAYRAPDATRIRALLHPGSAACLKAEPKYERYLMRAETRQPIPADAKVSVRALAPEAAPPFRGFEFPVRPSHVLRMEYGRQVSADGRSAITPVAEKHLAREGGRWYLVTPCATPEGLARLREMGLLD